MIGYATVGTDDLARASSFYDELFSELNAKKLLADDHITLWATKPGQGMFAVIKPHDQKSATVGNGVMVAFAVPDIGCIKRMHAKVLSLGGTDEGAPGPRGNNMDFAYARDLDGNKIAFYCVNKK